jgi:hypothetical protein
MKALCQEKHVDWSERFGGIDISCLLVTGDTNELEIPVN